MPAITGIADTLSDVLALVRMRGEMVCATEMAAPWGLAFTSHAARFHVVERGSVWIRVADMAPVHLETGDLVVLPLGAGHELLSAPDGVSTPIDEALKQSLSRDGAVYRMGGDGAEAHLVCGQFSFAGVLAPKLLTVLPPLIHIQPEPGRPLEWLRLTTHFLIEETRNPKPGSAIMIARLFDLLLIQAIRTWGGAQSGLGGWLASLSDAQIGRALAAIHEEPARKWTVEALAQVAGMSRSAFADRFAGAVGSPPLRYLSIWRLDLAADRLRIGGESIAQIAAAVGYGSEAAFNRAFKAQFGVPPAAFRKQGAALA